MSNLQRLQTEWATQREKYPDLKSWRLYVDRRAKTRAGVCNHTFRKVGISHWHLTNGTWEAVRDTLLHEIAHVLAGPFQGHNHVWQSWAIKVGATPRACYSAKDESMGLKLSHRVVCYTHGDIGGYPTRRKWMNQKNHTRICKRCRGPVVYMHSPSGQPIPLDKIPTMRVTAQPIAQPTTKFVDQWDVMSRVFPKPEPTPLPVAARQPARASSTGSKTFTYACMASDGVRCTNGIGSRERRMGIDRILKRLPHPMTKDEARIWLRNNVV